MLSLDQHCQLVPCSLRPLTTCSALEFIRRWLVMLRSSDHSTRFSKHDTPTAGTYRKLLSKCSSLAVMLGLLNASTSFGARVAGISPDSCENASFAAGECATSNELSATRHPLPPECKNFLLSVRWWHLLVSPERFLAPAKRRNNCQNVVHFKGRHVRTRLCI